MQAATNAVAQWAEMNGYDYQPNAEDLTTPGASDLDTFRNWDHADHLVLGKHGGRAFEILDLTKYFSGPRSGATHTHQTVLLLPNAAQGLPDFEVVPRNMTLALAYFGHQGLSLTPRGNGQGYERDLIESFKKHSRLYPGGVLESAAAAVKGPGSGGLALERVASMCTRPVFEFLTQHHDWYIEIQQGHLVAWTPGRVLNNDERSEMLTAAGELLDLLIDSKNQKPIADATLPSTFSRARVFGILAGVACGFFLGTFTAVGLSFINQKLILLIPVLALFGLILGGQIGGRIGVALFGKQAG